MFDIVNRKKYFAAWILFTTEYYPCYKCYVNIVLCCYCDQVGAFGVPGASVLDLVEAQEKEKEQELVKENSVLEVAYTPSHVKLHSVLVRKLIEESFIVSLSLYTS